MAVGVGVTGENPVLQSMNDLEGEGVRGEIWISDIDLLSSPTFVNVSAHVQAKLQRAEERGGGEGGGEGGGNNAVMGDQWECREAGEWGKNGAVIGSMYTRMEVPRRRRRRCAG